MNSTNDRISALILRQLREGLPPSGQAELDNWLMQSDQHRRLYDELMDEMQLNKELDRYHRSRLNTWNKLMEAIPELQQQEARVININRKNRFIRIAAAAVIVLLVSAGTYWLSRRTSGNEIVQTPQGNEHRSPDVVPGSDNATLMLADGSTIVLAGTKDGALASQQGVSLVKEQGELAYRLPASTEYTGELVYNTLATPRGGQYRVVLPDGSKVWINAASSLRYPVAFTGNERRVELKGEGYFEVAKNPSRPFKVSMNGSTGHETIIEVLGTHFDAMAYADEQALAATLLEGSVKVTRGNAQTVLKEGQQALVTDRISVVSPENTDAVVGWTKGFFTFRKTPLPIIMRQIARWYDVEIIYKEPVDEEFSGAVPRNKPLQEALKVLSLTQAVHFTVEGRKIIVTK